MQEYWGIPTTYQLYTMQDLVYQGISKYLLVSLHEGGDVALKPFCTEFVFFSWFVVGVPRQIFEVISSLKFFFILALLGL